LHNFTLEDIALQACPVFHTGALEEKEHFPFFISHFSFVIDDKQNPPVLDSAKRIKKYLQ
jgi:hypothetical protein